MSASVSSSVSRSTPSLAGAPDADGAAPAAGARAVAGPSARGASSGTASLLPWLGGGMAVPSQWVVSAPSGGVASIAGYASTTKATTKGSSGPKVTGEWAFLSDPSLSVEEKLARFLVAAQRKLDDDLTKKMDDYRARYGEGGTETKKEGGGIFAGILKALFPPLGIADALFGGVDGFLNDAIKMLGGPALAALATAVGLPMLAPAALKIGNDLGALVAGGTKTTKSKPASSSPAKADDKKGASKPKPDPKPDKKEAGSPDERLEMLEIQRLVEKQNQLYTLVSNVLKSVHDTAMTAIQNVR